MEWFFIVMLLVEVNGAEIPVRIVVETHTEVACEVMREKAIKYLPVVGIASCQQGSHD